jgi:hypothetical protein
VAIRDQRLDPREFGLCFGYSLLVFPQPSSSVTTWRLIATGIIQANATRIAVSSRRIPTLKPSQPKSSKSAEARLGSRPCALSGGSSSAFLSLLDSGTSNQILRSCGLTLGIRVWFCRDLPRWSRLGGCCQLGCPTECNKDCCFLLAHSHSQAL